MNPKKFMSFISATFSLSERRELEFIKTEELLSSISLDTGFKQIEDIGKKIATTMVSNVWPSPFSACIVRLDCGEEMNVIGSDHSGDVPLGLKRWESRSIYNKGFTGEVYRCQKLKEIENIHENNVIDEFISKEWIIECDLKSFFCFPLVASGKSIGVVSLFSLNHYSLVDDDREFIKKISLIFDNYAEILESIIQKEYNLAPQSKILKKIDSFLIHEFRAKEELILQERHDVEQPILLPMIVEVQESSWAVDRIPDCQELYRSGNTIICKGSLQSVKALNEDQKVVYVEASNVGIENVKLNIN
jgi:hypothetical protein